MTIANKNTVLLSCLMMALTVITTQAFVIHKDPLEFIHKIEDTEHDKTNSDLSLSRRQPQQKQQQQQQQRHESAAENPFQRLSNSKCYPLSIPMCRRLGYNSTSYQRTIYNSEGPDRAARYLAFFENELCFEDLLFFICTLYNPVCMDNLEKVCFHFINFAFSQIQYYI